jgi:hypothetical protein
VLRRKSPKRLGFGNIDRAYKDPIFGSDGPLLKTWKPKRKA